MYKRTYLFSSQTNKSDESASHCFELGWLELRNLLPNAMYRDVVHPYNRSDSRSRSVTGAGGRPLTLRVLCNVRRPVGGISVKDHVEVRYLTFCIHL